MLLRDPLVVTFNETRAPTSRKNVAEQGIVMPNWSKTSQTFWSHYSVFALEKHPKNLNFQSFYACLSVTAVIATGQFVYVNLHGA